MVVKERAGDWREGVKKKSDFFHTKRDVAHYKDVTHVKIFVMEKRFEDIIGLFKKAYGGGLSPEEEECWGRLQGEERWRRLWRELEAGTLAQEGMEDAARFPAERGFEAFKRLRGRGRRRRIRLFVTVGSVAAVLVVALNVVLTVWFEESERQRPERVVVSQGIYPERRSARLLLGTGETVTVGDGMRVVQECGGTKVAAEDGTLTFAEVDTAEAVVWNELVVPVGGESFVMLEDSTRVWLNADSRLRYPNRFEGGERCVELEGEAYFEVTKDAERSFVVATERGDVRVLGTSFDVRAYDEEALTATLVTGRVRYEGEGREVTLAPGEQVRVAKSGEVTKRHVDVEEYVGWRKGIYVFDQRPLTEIARDFERWYGVRILFMSQELRELPFTGYLERYDKIERFLELLRATGELEYMVDGKDIYLKKR